MDADFSHPPKDLIALFEACEQGADLSVGSRYKKGINVVNWPLYRILISYGASFYVKLITGMRVHDPTAGFVCYTRSVLEAIPLDRVRFVGYAFQIEMKFRAHVLGFVIEEVPIVFKDRELGKSKMSSAIVGEAIIGVLKLKWQSILIKIIFKMGYTIIKNGTLVNEGLAFQADVLIKDHFIEKIGKDLSHPNATVVEANGMWVLPGIIDDQVHFREPGLTHKGSIYSESRAAVAGGITTFMEQPNTNPQTTTIEALEAKFALGAQSSFANYAFPFGGTNDNLEELKRLDKNATSNVKLFLGSSTGNMLVDNQKVLEGIFKNTELVICTHCEDEGTIRSKYGCFYGALR
jgi:hypothetical protein